MLRRAPLRRAHRAALCCALPLNHPRQVRVVIGGVSISPGDWIYADEDGVVVSKEQLAL